MRDEGKIFEEKWKQSFEDNNIYIVRMKDNPVSWMNKDNVINKSIYGTDNPYDFFSYTGGHLLCMECKSTKKDYLTFSRKKEDKKEIRLNQIEGLIKARKHKGVFAGFVVEFRERKEVLYLDIVDFALFYKTSTKNSINYSDMIKIGAIKVDTTILKVRSVRYDIVELFRNVIEHRSGS